MSCSKNTASLSIHRRSFLGKVKRRKLGFDEAARNYNFSILLRYGRSILRLYDYPKAIVISGESCDVTKFDSEITFFSFLHLTNLK